MSILRSLVLICLCVSSMSHGLVLENQCGSISIRNNSEQALEVAGVYADPNEVLKTIVIDPSTRLYNMSLGTLKTCGDNASKVNCHAMWLVCHKEMHLTITTLESGLILFSGVVHANDSLSF
ncbi:MAG: hypothetical protein CK424_07240 [Legionella sp.]|nr:MAG: hypothetical protein CK424_07240 [Legionella sp.]